MTDEKKTCGLDLLREPFPAHQISKLPKPYKKDSPKGTCKDCGGYHGLPAMHLDYVGHAALTDRLLDTDAEWSWEPLAIGADGLPQFDKNGGLWIRLTVCGVSRLGYGHAEGKGGGDAIKEVIGDALRNAAMRFGAALDLWHKGQLHTDEDEEEPKRAPKAEEPKPASAPTLAKEWLEGLKVTAKTFPTIESFREHYAKQPKHLREWAETHEKAALKEMADYIKGNEKALAGAAH